MKLDLTVIKNESILKFEKSMTSVANKFMDMLTIGLDTAVHEIDPDKRKEVEIVLSDLLRDEFSRFRMSYVKCMNKASEIVENELGN